jgi:hypothetical protein
MAGETTFLCISRRWKGRLHQPRRGYPDQLIRLGSSRVESAELHVKAQTLMIALLAYAEAEAEDLIRENIDVVLALVDASVASPKGKLAGHRIDAVIEAQWTANVT